MDGGWDAVDCGRPVVWDMMSCNDVDMGREGEDVRGESVGRREGDAVSSSCNDVAMVREREDVKGEEGHTLLRVTSFEPNNCQ